jgi:hypothetical protein
LAYTAVTHPLAIGPQDRLLAPEQKKLKILKKNSKKC